MKIQKGNVAVITGGGGGIARCLAQALAAKGCNLALVDINDDALNENLAALSEYGVKTTLHKADVTSYASVETLAAEVLAQQGKVNILINNAGITLQKSFENHTLDDWNRVIGINLMGVIHGCKAFLPALKEAAKHEGAHIINMSSMTGFVGLPNQASYSGTKAAVRAISESLHAEHKQDNIGVTSVHPGAIKTKMILATLQESDDIKTAEKSYKMVEKIGNTPEYAAKRIVSAIEKNNIRIRIGKDAVIMDILKRFFPNSFSNKISKLTAKARTKKN